MYFWSKLNSDTFKIKKHLIKVIQKLRSHYRFHYNKLGKMRRILCFSVASSIYLALKCFTISMNQANHRISKIYSFKFKPKKKNLSYDLWKSWGAICLLIIPFSLKFFFSTLWYFYISKLGCLVLKKRNQIMPLNTYACLKLLRVAL